MLERSGTAKSVRWWAIATSALIVVLAGGAWLASDGERGDVARVNPSAAAGTPHPNPQASTPHPPSPFGDAVPVVGPDRLPADGSPAMAAAPAPLAELPPAGLSLEQWQQLRESLKDHPDRDGEIRRVAEYMAYNQTLDRFRLEKAQRADAAQQARLRELATTLDAGLDARLERSEISGAEARVLKIALLETLESDLTLRQARLEDWTRQHEVTQPQVSDPRDAEYERQQAAIVAAWYALPAEQRDAAQLQAQLEALRERIFGQP
jgi:hypothetical protein